MASKSDSQIWQEFIQAELKIGSKLGTLFEKATFAGYEHKNLTLYFPDNESRKQAQGQREKLIKKLPKQFLPCDRRNFEIGNVPVKASSSLKKLSPIATNKSLVKAKNPLSALIIAEPSIYQEKSYQSVLKAAVNAEQECNSIYSKLEKRTRDLVGEEGIVFSVSFNWRLRVGGTRGFLDVLLPVLHPIFGIPYIPASTLKGAARNWARSQDNNEIGELLGILEGKIVKAAKVEFLDAFPTKPCLSLDVATPQWHWRGDRVEYKAEPHPLVTLEQPNILIGLRPTSIGNANDVNKVKTWLENALKNGIGSRVSGGYGKALSSITSSNLYQSYDFEFWTQGMYGCSTVEFRSTAVRGVIRYWFRAVAMSLYDVNTCQILEEELFGTLGKQGKVSISTLVNPNNKQNPYFYDGKIYLEAKDRNSLDVVSKILILAVHLGGIGRGSRRPLHLLNGRMRGCHWNIINPDFPLNYDREQWIQFERDLKIAFNALKTSSKSYFSDPGKPKQRQQDVLDDNAQIWLLKSVGQVLPSKVKNWQTEGDRSNVRGTALNLLYGSSNFKGMSKGQGNANVGGALETPSFVWIKSVFPDRNTPYQVVTIFGANHPDRQEFAQELKNQEAILVFGKMQTSTVKNR